MARRKKRGVGRPQSVVPRLRPIRGVDMRQEIYQQLKKALISGRFKPGQPTPARILAAQLGTSVMPVREAIRQLVSIGGLQELSNRSVAVPLMTASRLRDLLPARLALEGLAAEQAAGRISDNSLDSLALADLKMRNLIQDSKTRTDARKYLELNRRLHFTIYSATESPTLLMLIEILWIQVGPNMHLLHEESSRWSADSTHGEILAAMQARDGHRARLAVQQDIPKSTEHAIEVLEDRQQY